MNTHQDELLRTHLAEWRTRLAQPWLVAAWPGMGAVAQMSQTWLARQLGA